MKAPPSDHTTILTSLIGARQRADENKQTHCFVTFDLPLSMKASEIVASIYPDNYPRNLCSVIPRLGCFHLLMSFLDSIGNVMWNLIVAWKKRFAPFMQTYQLMKLERVIRFEIGERSSVDESCTCYKNLWENSIHRQRKSVLNESLEKVGIKIFKICWWIQ